MHSTHSTTEGKKNRTQNANEKTFHSLSGNGTIGGCEVSFTKSNRPQSENEHEKNAAQRMVDEIKQKKKREKIRESPNCDNTEEVANFNAKMRYHCECKCIRIAVRAFASLPKHSFNLESSSKLPE